MTPEDKQIIDEYMEWGRPGVGLERKYDLNDAGLCVEKMVKKGDWADFQIKLYYSEKIGGLKAIDFVPWLFNPDNFFTAMAAWLKEK